MDDLLDDMNALEHDFANTFVRLYARPEWSAEQTAAYEAEYVERRLEELQGGAIGISGPIAD